MLTCKESVFILERGEVVPGRPWSSLVVPCKEAASAGELTHLVAQPGTRSVHYSDYSDYSGECKGFPRPTSTLNLFNATTSFPASARLDRQRATVFN